MSYRKFLKLAKNIAGRDISKKAGKVADRWGFPSLPPVPRLLFFAIPGVVYIGYYLVNGGRFEVQRKKEEPLGEIKIENYNERLAKYATSMEIALQPNGRESSRGVRDVIEVYNQLGLNFQDVSRDQLIAFQKAEKVRNERIRTILSDRTMLNMSLRGKYFKALTEKEAGAVQKQSAVIPSAVNKLTPAEEKVLADLAVREEQADLEFWSSILEASTPEQRRKLSKQASEAGNIRRPTLLPHSFANLSSYLSPYQRPHVFVLKFDGKRSQHLRSSITGLF